jgi:beta-1,4-mannosyltransferase
MRPSVLADPPAHPYVDRLHGRVAHLVHRDADLLTRHDPDWITAHAREWDIAHLHLGLSDATPERVASAVAAHRRRGVPVVVTVHDLRLPDASGGWTDVVELLREIDRAVAAVVTLTPRCAASLQVALDRPIRVIPHGPALPRPTRERLRAQRRLHRGGGPMVLVAGGLDRQVGWVEAVEAASRTLSGAGLLVAVDPAHAATAELAVAGYPNATVTTTTGVADESLHRAVATAPALVVPLRWGGHSGLVELAADVGTPVVATDVGFVADQVPTAHLAPCPDGQIDVDGLARAMDEVLTHPPVVESDRDRDDQAFVRGHERLYRRLLLGRTPVRSLSGAAVG